VYSRLGKVGDQVMDDTIRVFSGRTFSPDDIEIIKWVRKTYPKLSRSEIAGTVCEMLNWTTPAGNAKLPQCKAFLSELETEGIIQLPPPNTKRQNRCKVRRKVFEFDTSEIKGEIGEYEPISLTIAISTKITVFLSKILCQIFLKKLRHLILQPSQF